MPMSPKPSRAVAEAHAARIVEADDAKRARWREVDWFATPPFATRAGAEMIRDRGIDPLFGTGVTWEPACGDGIMARALGDVIGDKYVLATDLEPQGYGQKRDFLLSNEFGVRWVFTNPPFPLAAEFVEHGLGMATVGVAILCRLSFLESGKRYDMHRRHLMTVGVFSERVPMQLGPWNPECSTATAYAWFFYSKDGVGGDPPIKFIPPGTRARLTMPNDIQRFCTPTAGSLL